MRIELSKEQYRKLLELVAAGDWLINGNKTPEQFSKEYEDIQKHIFSFYQRFESEDLIEYDQAKDTYFQTNELLDKISPYGKEYSVESLFTELASQLAEQDAERKYQPPTLEQIWKLESMYEEEFDRNGLKRVSVDWNKKD